jgi:hypothetical protein
LGEFVHCGFGAFGLFGGEFADGGKECSVGSTSVNEKSAENFENASFVGSVEGGGIVRTHGELGLAP